MRARWSLSGFWTMGDPFSGVEIGDTLIHALRSSPRRGLHPPAGVFGNDILDPSCVRLALSVHRVR